MTSTSGTPIVQDHQEVNRYELVIDGQVVGIADYEMIHRAGQPPAVHIPHTEISPARRGQGLGAVFVEGILSDVRATGRRVIPTCWYVAGYIDAHPEHADLVTR